MKIITYNIHKGMNIYNENTLIEMIPFLKKINAEIICLQEVLESIHFKILKQLNINGYFLKTVELNDDNYGIAIYYKKRINYVKSVYLKSQKEQRGFIHIQLVINNKIINIINTHLGLSEYIRKLQINEIYNYTKKLNQRVIICGDFNERDIVIKNYYDLAVLFRLENIETFQPSKSRIDYIFISKKLKPVEYNVELINLSDHYPVIGKVII